MVQYEVDVTDKTRAYRAQGRVRSSRRMDFCW